ncbi:hypothetical protein LIER_14170 [Lithospermum erythrorhizon]|uniref:Uncharacterized protein n=1 Tax=Lithospermum erythrorhizon TaxID=34254 RepID=A0AAV3Q1D5_LITER
MELIIAVNKGNMTSTPTVSYLKSMYDPRKPKEISKIENKEAHAVISKTKKFTFRSYDPAKDKAMRQLLPELTGDKVHGMNDTQKMIRKNGWSVKTKRQDQAESRQTTAPELEYASPWHVPPARLLIVPALPPSESHTASSKLDPQKKPSGGKVYMRPHKYYLGKLLSTLYMPPSPSGRSPVTCHGEWESLPNPSA